MENSMNLAFRLSMAVIFFPMVAGALLHLAGRFLAPPAKERQSTGDPPPARPPRRSLTLLAACPRRRRGPQRGAAAVPARLGAHEPVARPRRARRRDRLQPPRHNPRRYPPPMPS
jgi:hypothetical protein